MKWKPLGAGISDGKVLLLASDECLAFVTRKPFERGGYEITKIPRDVLAALLNGASRCTDAAQPGADRVAGDERKS